MNSVTLIVYEYWYFQLAKLKFRPHVNIVFDFISVSYTITDLQAHETL